MDDSQGQFIAVCPNCSAILRVSVNKLGQNVRCSQCHRTFVGGEALESVAQRSAQPPPQSQSDAVVERIDAVCPGCNATLHVRRAYIGNDVRCKHCESVFRVEAPADARMRAAHDQSEARDKSLQAEHERLNVAYNLLEAITSD